MFVVQDVVVSTMRAETNYTVTPIWNVCGRIEGDEEPDRMVLVGREHHLACCQSSLPMTRLPLSWVCPSKQARKHDHAFPASLHESGTFLRRLFTATGTTGRGQRAQNWETIA